MDYAYPEQMYYRMKVKRAVKAPRGAAKPPLHLQERVILWTEPRQCKLNFMKLLWPVFFH